MKHWPAEFQPRSLCEWGGGDDSSGGGFGTGGGDWGSASGGYGGGGFDAGGGPGGWGETGGGPATGGGDWGSSGSFNAAGMFGYTDAASYAAALAASPGGFYDTGGAGLAPGALGAEFGGTFGTTGISGQPGDPQGAFGAELDAGGGGLSGVGRAIESWGRGTPATEAGQVGSYADLSGGLGGPAASYGGYSGGGSYGGRGGGFGDFGTGTGTGTGGGGRGGGVSRSSVTENTPGFTTSVSGGKDVTPLSPSGAPTRGEAEVESVSQSDLEAGPDVGPDISTSLGEPSKGDEPAPGPSTAEPSPSQAEPSAAPDRGPEQPQTAPAFGPQSLDWSSVFEGAAAPAATSDPTDWGSVFEGAAAPQVEPGSRDFFSGGRDFWGNVLNPSPIETSKSFWDANTWLSPTSQQTFNEIANLPSTLNPSVPVTLQAPTTMDLQALGEQGRAGQQTDMATQLGAPDISPGGIDPGAAQYSTAPDPATQLGIESISPVDWASVFEGAPTSPDWTSVFEGAAPTAEPNWGAVFEGAAPDTTDWGSVFEGAPGDIDWGAVFEGAAPTYDETMDPAPATAAPPSTDNAATPGADPALSGNAVADAAANAAKDVGAPQAAQDAARDAARDTVLNGGTPAEQATAAMAAALDKGATQAQADAIAAATLEAAVNQAAAREAVQPGMTNISIVSKEALDQALITAGRDPTTMPAVNLPSVRAITPAGEPNWGSVFEGAAPVAAPQQAPPGPELTSEATGTQATIPGGRTTDFNYATQAQPGLADMRGQPGTTATIPGGRTTDFNYPTSSTPPPPSSALPPADQPMPEGQPGGVSAADRAARGPGAVPESQHVQDARQYLLSTANPGDTMNQQGPDVAIARLKPNFAVRLANAVREARANGLPNASVFSAYRAPTMGANPGYASVSQHGRGIAVDMSGIGRPRSVESRTWYDIATRNGLFNPYGPSHAKEWNHYQAIPETGRQTANRLGVNPRTAPASMVPTWDRVGVRPAGPPAETQQAGVPTPRGRPAEAPQAEVAAPADYQGAPYADLGAPAQQPAALPPQEVPLDTPRPPTDIPIDIPVQTVPPRAGRADPVMLNRAIESITTQALRGIGPQTTKEQAIAKGAAARAAMVQAGIPASMANPALLDLANKTAAAMGYARGDYMGMVGSAIDKGIAEAMRGYAPAAPGPVQGPPAPADLVAPGKRSEAPFGQQFAGMSQDTGRQQWDDYGREGDVGAASPYFGGTAPTLPQLSPLVAPPAPPPSWGQPPPPAPGPRYTPTTPGMFSPFRGNEAALPETSQQTSLLSFLQNFNPISTAEARGGRGQSYPAPPGSTRSNPHFTFYGPGPGGRMEGGFETSRPNQAGTNVPITLDMVRSAREQGRDLDVTLASDPSRYGETINVGTVTYVSPIDGKQYTLDNVRGFVHDTGRAFKGRPEKVDIAVSDYTGWSERAAGDQAALAHIGAAPNAIVVGGPGEIGAPAVGAMPPAAPMPAPNPMRGLAKGGRVDDDEPVVVGEQGPEVFVPDRPGTVVPHMPQPGGKGNVDRWPKVPAPEYPGRYGGVEREIRRQTRAAQDVVPGLMEMIDSGRLRLNAANWQRMLNDPALIALGRSRIEANREGINPGAEQYGAFIPGPEPAMAPPDPASPMAQALGYGSIARPRPLRIGRQSYQER